MRYSFSFIVTAFLLMGVVTATSCKRNDSRQSNHDLYYFPEKNIYYDTRNSMYYYSLDSAVSWDSLAFNGSNYGAALGEKVPVVSTGADIWTNNDSHRKAYNGVLLNLVNSNTLFLAREDSLNRISQAVAIKPKPVIVKEESAEEEAPKKGLKKFFDRLFGRKKHPKE